MRRCRATAPIAVFLLLAACGPQAATTSDGDPSAASRAAAGPVTESLLALADVGDGWSTLRPGGETICALGTEYSFFARRGDPQRLLVYLQGGGACWRGENCDPEVRPTYARDVDRRDDPGRRPVGIFDLDNPDNPFADHSMVMVPYCTGDVHIGDRDAVYRVEPEDEPPREITVHHRGYVNAMTVLEWVFANFESPAEVFVTGSSAGSIPAPFYAQIVAERYPEARVTALGDAAGAYRREAVARTADGGSETVRAWGTLDVVQRHPGYEELDEASFGFEDLYLVAGRRHPDLQLLQFDAAWDATQAFYLELGGAEDPDVPAFIRAGRDEIRAGVERFAGFLAGGPEHTILWRPAFYFYEVDGVLFRDWVAAAVAGEPLDDVECQDCGTLQVHPSETDLRIIERARELLATADAWDPEDEAECTDAAPWSLRCALRRATEEIAGPPARETAALLATRAAASEEIEVERRRSVLRAYNDAPDTDLDDIRALLESVARRLRSHGHD